LSIVVFKANIKQKIDMEIVITTTIRFIKKVQKVILEKIILLKIIKIIEEIMINKIVKIM
jgi:hypothetical protein